MNPYLNYLMARMHTEELHHQAQIHGNTMRAPERHRLLATALNRQQLRAWAKGRRLHPFDIRPAKHVRPRSSDC
jgi:hypothetical protein